MTQKSHERIAYRSHRSPKQKRTWRTFPDALLPVLESASPAQSLHPGPDVIRRYADCDPVARAIINAWNPVFGFARLIRQEAA